MEISTRCGQDSDCNPSSAAGVLGVMLGYAKIPDEFKSGIAKIANTKFEFTDYSFNSICQSTLDRALALIEQNGGQVTEKEVVIPEQKPQAPKLEQWDPGIADRKIEAGDSSWTWKGDWAESKGVKASTAAGNEATLKFTGVAVAVIGPLNQEGGRAQVFIDDRPVGSADAYIVERTHDNVLWHTYGLAAGGTHIAHSDSRTGGFTLQRKCPRHPPRGYLPRTVIDGR